MYAVIPSHGCYGSGETVRSAYGTADRSRAITRAKKLTREHQRAMRPYGGTSGGYRVVETEELCCAGDIVAGLGHDADKLPTVQ